MLVRKLRLQRGWSQEHLAQLTGLNVRTIQRIERGNPPSLETLSSLASVFEIELNLLQERIIMNTESKSDFTEQKVIEHVQDIKGFYTHLAIYVCVLFIFLIINLIDSPAEFWVYLPAMGWGIGILIHGLSVFEVFSLLGPDWERKQIDKRLGRKL